jgi:hypothetical protein
MMAKNRQRLLIGAWFENDRPRNQMAVKQSLFKINHSSQQKFGHILQKLGFLLRLSFYVGLFYFFGKVDKDSPEKTQCILPSNKFE